VSRVKISLPDQTDSEIQRLVETGEFLDRDKAVEELLTLGISAYETTDDEPDEFSENAFNTPANEQQDPAIQDDSQDDGYTL
jgi:Arc/MetJ-type ribon-helix-helix transcriptional regulator